MLLPRPACDSISSEICLTDLAHLISYHEHPQLLGTETGPASTDVMMPGQAISVDMDATKAGTWPMYCQVHDHMEAGMIGQFTIQPKAAAAKGRKLLRQWAT